jgi:uncharacterized membrane protein
MLDRRSIIPRIKKERQMSELKNNLINNLLQILNQLPEEWVIIIISCFPILELRGGIPIAISIFGMSFWEAYMLGVAGNMLPVLPLLLLFQPISDYMMRFSWYSKVYQWMYNRTINKSKSVQRYGALGLILFTAVPLPTTGAWTACLAACIFSIRLSYAFISIFIGVLIAGLIMGGFSYSIFG